MDRRKEGPKKKKTSGKKRKYFWEKGSGEKKR